MCKFYLAGWCGAGGTCKYAHYQSELKPMDQPVAVMCKYFQQGTCQNGAGCRFAHDEVQLVRQTIDRYTPDTATENPALHEFIQNLQLQLQQHDLLHESKWRQKGEMCKLHMNGGLCPESYCKNSHSEEEMRVHKQMLEIEKALKSFNFRNPHKGKQAMCKYFMLGECSNGGACRFAHDMSELTLSGKNKSQMCKW